MLPCRTLLKRTVKAHRTYGERPAASEEHSVFLSLFDTLSGRVERKMLVGNGRAGQVVSSDACLVVVSRTRDRVMLFADYSSIHRRSQAKRRAFTFYRRPP